MQEGKWFSQVGKLNFFFKKKKLFPYIVKPGRQNHPYSLALNENPHADFYSNVTSVSKAELLSEVQHFMAELLPLVTSDVTTNLSMKAFRSSTLLLPSYLLISPWS